MTVHDHGAPLRTEGCQPLLGQIPLETLDWWIDITNHRLVGNPEHGGEWMAGVF